MFLWLSFTLVFVILSTSWLVKQIFVLSAVSPEKMPLALQNIRKILKVRDISILTIVKHINFINFGVMNSNEMWNSNLYFSAKWLCAVSWLCYWWPCSGWSSLSLWNFLLRLIKLCNSLPKTPPPPPHTKKKKNSWNGWGLAFG